MSEPINRSHKQDDEPSIGKVVLDDLKTANFKRSLRRDLHDLYRFYLSEERREELASMGSFKAMFFFWAWLAKGLLMKLSPVRRVTLLGAVVLMLWGTWNIAFTGISLDIHMELIGVLLVFVVLMLELKDKLLARDEIEVARQVQLALLPRTHPTIPGWSIWSHTRAANEVGGDLVDYMDLDEKRLGVVLGDVAGKGLGAALLMSKLQATLRAIATDSANLHTLGLRLNTILFRDGLDNRFSTLFYFELTPGSGHLRYLNAGHNPAYVLRPDRSDSLPASGMPLGMVPETGLAEETVDLQPGEILVVYSDGLTEALNQHDVEYGEERLERFLPKLRGMRAEEAGRILLAEVERFIGDARQYDDLSLIVAAHHG